MPNQSQASIGGLVVELFFKNKVGHAKLTCRVVFTWELSA